MSIGSMKPTGRAIPFIASFVKGVGRNSGALTVSGVGSKLATFGVLVLANRGLPREQFGAYALVLATAEIIRVVSAFGVDQVSLRALARRSGQDREIVSTALVLKILTSVLASLLFAMAGWYLQFTAQMWIGFALLVCDFFLSSAALSLATFHQANIRADRAAPATLLGAAASLLTGFAAFQLHWPMPLFLATVPMGSMVTTLALWLVTRRWVHPSLRAASMGSLKQFFRSAWPIATTGIIVLLYFRVSTLMLAKLDGLAAVAAYASAYKISEAFLLVPLAVSGTTLPILSNALGRGPTRQGVRAYESALIIAGAVSLPFGIFCSVFGRFVLVHLFGPSYASSAFALGVLGWATVLMALNMQTTNALLALGRERLILLIATVNLGTNVLLNVIVIPQFGFDGSAIATLVTETVNVAMQAVAVALLLRPSGFTSTVATLPAGPADGKSIRDVEEPSLGNL